jgi:hypothetical protein
MNDYRDEVYLMMWVAGLDGEHDFAQATGMNLVEAWEQLPEWQKDDYIFAVKKLKEWFKLKDANI